MARILIVDDEELNRQLLLKLLVDNHHQVFETSDGAEALALVRSEKLDLIICDVLMPTMDGYEFVRQLRADAEINTTRVIFITGHHLTHEARALAEASSVDYIIYRPSTKTQILSVVEAALASDFSQVTNPTVARDELDREQLQLLTDQFAGEVYDLTALNHKLTALIDLSQRLASERDPLSLLKKYSDLAREIIGAKWNAVGLLNDETDTLQPFYTIGLNRKIAARINPESLREGVFARPIKEARACRIRIINGDVLGAGLPAGFPALSACLLVPIYFRNKLYGSFCLGDKLGALEFSELDEKLAVTLVGQMAEALENATLYRESQLRAMNLEEKANLTAKVEQQRTRLNNIISNVPGVVWTTWTEPDEARQRINFVSDYVETLLGYSAVEYLATPNFWLTIVHPDDRDRAGRVSAEHLASGEDYAQEFRWIARDGHIVWVATQACAIRDEQGNPVGMRGVNLDVTERMQAEIAQDKSQERYESLVHSIDGIVWEMDVEAFRFTFVSQQVERILGYTPEQMVGTSEFWTNALHPDNRKWVIEFCQKAALRGKDHQFDYRIMAADGRVVWLRDFVTVETSNTDKLTLRGVMVDITESKRADIEREIIFEVIKGVITTRNLEELLKLIHNSISKVLFAENCMVVLQDPTTDLMNFEYWVDQRDTVPPAHALRHGFCNHVLRTNEPLLLTNELRKELYESGAVEKIGAISASWLGVPLRTTTRVIGVLAVQNYDDEIAYSQRDLEFLTSVGDQVALAIERKRAEQEKAQLTAQIEQQRLRLNTIIANVPGVVWEGWGNPDSENQNIDFVSDYVEVLLGYSVDEWLQTPNFWLTIVHPEDHDRAARISAHHYVTGESYSQDFRWIARDGHVVWVEAQTSVIRNTDGTIIGMRGVNIDVTERKLAEEALRATEAQLRQSQKLEAVGQLAGGIAHDFNNLLTVITGYSDLTLRNLERENPLRSGIVEIKKAGESAASLTRQLLAFSRKQVLQPKVLNVNAIVANVDKMLRRLIGEDIDLSLSLEPALGQVRADPGQIEQVIINIAVNARDAMPHGGMLTISTSNVYLDDFYARDHVSVRPGWYAMVAMSDNGSGMNAETKSKIFEPFFTTKESGKGTGLGLSTVYGIVKQSDGNIWVYSEEGNGTTFKIYLPCVVEAVSTKGNGDKSSEIRPGIELILLAEDEDQVREMTRGILEMNGYRVLDAMNGKDALSIFAKHKGEIDLVLTDAVMPHMSGRELAENIHGRSPDIKVLYMSGYTNDAIVRHGLLDQSIAFLEKPFTPDALLRKVRDVLDAPIENKNGLRILTGKA